jgi:hypothetical protein
MTALAPRVVIVTRPSGYRELLDRHGTPGAVEYFLRDRAAAELRDLRALDVASTAALAQVQAAVPAGWRVGRADRAELAAFPFVADDIVVSVGPDGLVANVAKYLDAQPVIGVCPAGPGVLARHHPGEVAAALRAVASGAAAVEERVTVRAELDDGQQLRGLNEVFVGDAGHQSARYLLRTPDGRGEPQSSSGVLVGTGTGATGWCASVARTLADAPPLPAPAEPALCWFVREAWPSPTTAVDLVAGRLAAGEHLELTVGSDRLVVFSDGGEADRLVARRGQRVTIGLAPQRLRLVSAASTTSGAATGAPPTRRARRR